MRPLWSLLRWLRLAMLSGLIGCGSAPWDADPPPKYSADAGDGCAAGFTSCGHVCCPAGMLCSDGACTYPYNTARLYVYLCPSFNMGCNTSYFALGQTCSAVRSAQPGTCYDTGFEVAASSTYAFAGCTACGSGCGGPVGIRTPAGFLDTQYAPGLAWYCGTKCDAPSDCGGQTGSTGARCDTYDCWLNALSLREGGVALPLVTVKQATAPSSTSASSPAESPRFHTINGTSVDSSVVLQWELLLSDQLELAYEFSDPNGCSPALCLSLPRCPQGVRCTAGTTTVCSRAKHDGARLGSVVRSLAFTAEPTGSSSMTELPLTLQLVAGPMDLATASCKDPIDESDPAAPRFTPDALASDPVEARITLMRSSTTEPTGGSSAAGRSGSAGAGGAAQVDCNCYCESGTVCTGHGDCGVDENGIPNVCGCPVGPPCEP